MIFHPSHPDTFKEKALSWAQKSPVYMFLNGNNYPTLEGSFPEMLAIGVKKVISCDEQIFETLKNFRDSFPDSWLFGYISYDAKNEIENLSSGNPDRVHLNGMYFFEPEVIIHFHPQQVKIETGNRNPDKIFKEIMAFTEEDELSLQEINFSNNLSKIKYLKKITTIKNHILEGDIYELNFCMQYLARHAQINSLQVYKALNQLSPAPFSILFENETHSIISSSPERFLKRDGNRIISQPMKGTIRRGKTEQEDTVLKQHLKSSDKEIAENMMITDLVRNDLSKSCKVGTVKVDELFGIYSFPRVHQMITSISGELPAEMSDIEVLRNAFPMGSMTGAPKIRAMELIETYENFYRGPFSGAAGYFAPNSRFDLNVLIRSFFYNKNLETLSFAVGSAITYDCDPEKEYEECLLKGETLIKIFSK